MLSEREIAVLEALLKAKRDSEIASECGITVRTVKAHMQKCAWKIFGNRDDMNGPFLMRVRLATFVHEHRHLLGVRCPCDGL
jgi:DNA-binding NarL/FixJ family response regulator